MTITGKLLGLTFLLVLILAALSYALPKGESLPCLGCDTSVMKYRKVKAPVGKPFTDHALLKHNSDALRAEECGSNPLLTVYNPATRRFADICRDSAGLWASFIYEIEEGLKREVTSFEKEKMNTLEKVLNYLKNRGYGNDLPEYVPVVVE